MKALADEAERTRYVTEFRERETGAEFWRSGSYIGTFVVPAGVRPFRDRDAYYDVVEVHKNRRTTNGIDAVFDAVDRTEAGA